MPYKAKKPCKEHGCNQTVSEGRYCPQHYRLPVRRRTKDNRRSAYRRGYNREWQAIREEVLACSPVCEYCGKVKAKHVHHIPDYQLGTNHRDYELRAICQACHNRVTRRKK